ncbi:MAG: LemA family protein [Gemmataceae bacterium]|nr:LemA family protein [Gemmataceae bacterium]
MFAFIKKVFLILGIILGLLVLIIFTLATMIKQHDPSRPAWIGAGMALLAWILWMKMRSLDRRNAILAGAPPLPIRLVNVDDDVWVHGEIACDNPVQIPYFPLLAVNYSYSVQEQVTTTRTDSNGRTVRETTWVTRESGSDSSPFRIVDGEHFLWLDPAQATFYDQWGDGYQVGVMSYSCTYTPAEGPASAVGVVAEGKQSLIPKEHIPLIVTLKDRPTFLKDAEANEKTLGHFGSTFAFFGFYLAFYGLGRMVEGETAKTDESFSKMGIGFGVFLGVPMVFLLWFIRVFNTLVIFRNRVRETWSQVDVILKQRYDLIPSLVETVRGYMQHERAVLETLGEIRGRAVAGGSSVRIGSEKDMVGGIIRLIALAENYPELKASQMYLKMGDEITALEEKIAHARANYNNAVTELNTQIGVFPERIVAGLFGIGESQLFAAELDAMSVPRISLGNT